MAVLVLGISQAVSAGVPGGYQGAQAGGPPHISADKWESMATYLDLTDEQSQKILGIQQEHFNNTRELRNQLQKAMFDLNQMRWEKAPDQNKLNEAINNVNSLRDQLFQQKQKTREQINSVLTQEQLAKMGKRGPGPISSGHRGAMGNTPAPQQ